jgi:TPP-dependent 2-oxoacid decarboxylase
VSPRRQPPHSLGEHVIEALRRRGVRHLFGIPGDFILGLFKIGAERGMVMVNSTREETAVYAADGYARERGLGAAATTFGVGALATAAAMGGANAESVPVVVIAGAPGLGERDGRRLHHTPGTDIDAPRRALAQVVGETLLLDDLETAREALEDALDRCLHTHRPLYVEVPRDLFDERPGRRRRRAEPGSGSPPPSRTCASGSPPPSRTCASACWRRGGRSSGRASACCGAITASGCSGSPSGPGRRWSSR